MQARRSRVPQLTVLIALVLIVVILDSDPAEAARGWDAGRATQGLVLLGGFTVALLAGLVLLARTMTRVLSGPRVGVRDAKQEVDASEDIAKVDVSPPADP